MVLYRDLYFGLSDGRREARQAPEQFVKSFVDRNNAMSLLKSGQKFLLLGPKGAGKSAFAAYLDKTQDMQTGFVQIRDLSTLPFDQMDKVKTGEPGGPGRVITVWKLLLYTGLLEIIMKDQSHPFQWDPQVLQLVDELRRLGFMSASPKAAVLGATKTTYKLTLPGFGNVYTRERTESFNLYHVVNYLEDRILSSDSSGHTYMLILDGLDSIYLTDPNYSSAIASLLQAAYEVYDILGDGGSQARVVLLLRNDIFTRLQLPDAGKMRQDLSIDLDWRVLSGNPRQASLFDLVNRKASAMLDGRVLAVVQDFFPKDVQLGDKSPKWRDIYSYLLDLTRHTPRDLLRLLEYIREVEGEQKSSNRPGAKLSNEVIREGALRYASKYFVEAIANELVGLREEGDLAARAISTLRHLRKSTFTARQFSDDFLEGSDGNVAQANEMLKWLFFAGAVGNVVAGSSERYLQFYHRRDNVEIYIKGELILHNALVYAWNIPR
ncbi:P-loop ATPase, Sll1717 family [Saccharothrix sp. NRRL B-16348]|uniref:P-loop ATPase, Sll1717 family n=1 Tax=Saccharothrix sp. NRRL B-16348 TaxID=1415542 RepID=UPI000AF2DD73|nr:hypothetical protein [Saccharothrix sp. NRRL B-16348]